MKYITSHSLNRYDSGIYSLIINTTDKWMYYQRVGETKYYVWSQIEEDNCTNYSKAFMLNFIEFLPTDKRYIKLERQDKDQIVFYFIPVEMMLHGTRIVAHSEIKM